MYPRPACASGSAFVRFDCYAPVALGIWCANWESLNTMSVGCRACWLLARGESTASLGPVRSRAGLHNLIHLVLACAGVALGAVALLDLLVHPLSLWLNIP